MSAIEIVLGRQILDVLGPSQPLTTLGAAAGTMEISLPDGQAAFATVRAAPGEAVGARLRVPARAFARYDEDLASWIWPGGQFTVQIGSSSRALPITVPVVCGTPAAG